MRKNYKKANHKIKKKIENELVRNGLNEFFIENRVKSDESIKIKLNSKDEFGDNKEITDYSGVRIILISVSEMRKCIEIIAEKFEVDYFNSNINPHSFIDENQFGYRSSHIIVIENEIKTEVQIRTLSQHIWATISHSLDYKNTKKDSIFRRKLFRLSSLLEQVDISIEDLYKTAPDVHESNITSLGYIDHYSLEYYLSRKKRIFALIVYSFGAIKKRNKKGIKPFFDNKYDTSLRILDGSSAHVGNDKFSLEIILAVSKKLNLVYIKDFRDFLKNKVKHVKTIRKAYNSSELSKLAFISNASKVYLFLFSFLSKSDLEVILKGKKVHEKYYKMIIEFTDIYRNIR